MWVTSVDLLLVYVWYYHGAISMAFSFFRWLMDQQRTWASLSSELLVHVGTTVVFGYIERLLKEDWVLYDSFKKAERVYMKLVDSFPDPTFVTELSGRIVYLNASASALVELARQHNPVQRASHDRANFLELVHNDYKQRTEKALKQVLQSKLPAFELPLHVRPSAAQSYADGTHAGAEAQAQAQADVQTSPVLKWLAAGKLAT